ncbi:MULTISPECIES: DUF6691 family protein [unclassified Methylophilus]|uniref:DUF6691 family protein n=1 Tax=unclassified Methylophilus TaxID=2630143 RepID=UPI0006FAE49E|nr:MULTISPECIES: DUF6691 family protein [unclassified Methylophilus]KQT41161.1 hypothetical protein ASG34_10380 [Methylophilus sp. Leaf416]KQT58371.1 hypothetical protein ASG44_11935 [Methylophilus sp. Leaf459]
MANLIALIAGLVFGLGLIIGGMTNPAKVLGFLDVAGDWDPSLAFVMIGAIAVGFFAFRDAKQRKWSELGVSIDLPERTNIDQPLVIGAVLFGIGWGLAGFCPGPAVAAMLIGGSQVWIFVASMLAGMGLYTLATKLKWL